MANIQNNQILYTASSKLTETTNRNTAGLHTDRFNATIVSHTFSNGEGEIVFDSNVTLIDGRAFYSCRELTSVTLPDTVITIGNSAFYDCRGLASINIPNNVTTIDNNAFYYCFALTSITIPNGVITIGSYAFQGCKFTSMVIPDSVTSIGEGAFFSCDSMTTFTFGNGITVIPDSCFYGATSLVSVNIPNGVTSIGWSAFNLCTSLSSPITIPDTVTSIGQRAFYSCRSLTSVTIGNGITTIDNLTFYNCTNLATLVIGNSVTTISANAFQSCTGFTSITVSSGNTKYDSRDNCNALIETATNKLILGAKNTTIPNTVTSIANNAFNGSLVLTTITIPSSVTSIGKEAFNGCANAVGYYFESTTPPSIGTYVFSNDSGCYIYVPYDSLSTYKSATNWSSYASRIKPSNVPNNIIFYVASSKLTETTSSSTHGLHTNAFNATITSHTFSNGEGIIEFDDDVTTIGNSAFWGCSDLISVTLPDSVTTLGDMSFCYCQDLKTFTVPVGVTSISSSTLSGCDDLVSIKVDSGNQTYDSRDNCNAIIETATNTLVVGCKTTVIPNTVTAIGNNAFENCHYLTSITIPSSVISIGNRAFSTASLESVTFSAPSHVTTIGNYAFSGAKLTTITIPNSVTTMGTAALSTGHLESVTLSNNLTSIPDSCFNNCSKLENIVIPSSVTSIGNSAFYMCFALKNLTIPSSVTTIGNDAFHGCDGMESYYFRSTTPPTIGSSWVFFDSGCPIYVPDGSVNAYKTATNWSSYASRIRGYNVQNTQISYTALSKLPETTSIGLEGLHINAFNATIISHTFSNGVGLIEFDDDVTTIGNYAFYNSSELTSITIPDGVTSIGNHAFDSCILLDSINLANVTTIGESAFNVCMCLSTANLSNATSLGTNAFGGCESLQNIILSDSLTTIPDSCFNNCISLETLEIPNTVTSIGEAAFFNDTSLKEITIPSSVTSIGDEAFAYCTDMEGYYFESTTPPTIGTDVFANDSGCYIYVPEESVNTYKTATNWVTWRDRIYSNRHQTPKPTISPSSGIYVGDNLTVLMSSTAISGTTYYTIDGSTPTTGSTEYTSPFQITTSGTTVVKAIGYSDYYTNKTSNVASQTYELYNAYVIVRITPPSGGIATTETHVDLPVSISATGHTGNVVAIYYTTDGTTPTTNSTRYTGVFNLGIDYGHSKYVKALAVTTYGGATYTATDTAVYTLQNRTQPPTVLPQSGDYHEGFILDITYPNGSDVYYTLDGSTPTSGSTKYTEQIYIDSNTVFKAIAYDVNNEAPDSEVVHRNYTFSDPTRSRKAPRNEDNFNGIYVKDVDYSGTTPSILDEADVTWGYRIDNADENLGEYGTRCHVEDTSILIHIDFTHGGKDYSLDKEIPVTCIVQDAQYKADILDLIQGSAIVTLTNTLEVSIRAKVTHTSESQTSSIVDLSNFTLSGTSTNGNFTCSKEGSYFVYDDTLTYDYKGSTHPANDITLTLINNNTQQQLSTLVIPVTFQAGSIFDVKDDAIRMAVASSITYTDSGITYVNNRITDVEINVSGLTSTVSSITTDLSGVTYDVSQIEQRCDRIETNVTNISGDMVTHSEIIQVATAITANVYDELNERTGIDIYNGTITLDADYTYITGNLMLSGATDGISFSDASGNTKISLSTELLPNLEQFDMGTITRKRGGVTQQIDTIQQSITTNFTDVPLGQYSQGQTIQIDYIVFTAHFSDAPFDERLETMTYIIAIKQNSTVIGTHSGSCTRVYEFMDEFTTGSMSTTATGTGDVTIDMSITCTNKSTAEPKTGRWQTSYNMLYQKVEVAQTTIRLNGLATFQDTTHYAWLGPDQTAFRQGESTLRLKNGRIERTPIRAEGGMTSPNFADVSTVVPFRIVNGLTHSASTQNDGLIIFSTVLGEADSAQRTLYLGDPSECQGKILYVKNIVGANTKVKISSDVYRQDLLMPCNSVSEVTEISIGAYSSMFISDGFNWIQFHCA